MKHSTILAMRALSAPMLSVALFTLVAGCGDAGDTQAAEAERPVVAAPATSPAKPAEAAAASTETVAPAPTSPASRDEMFRGAPSCIYTISYQERTDHEIRWKGNRCSDLSASFMSVSDLEKYEKLDDLNAAERSSLVKDHPQGVFYVEGEFTASIYPQDSMGMPHEISIAD
jgi:hypothetical protein